MQCFLQGTPGVDYTDAQGDQSFATMRDAVRQAEPDLKWFRVTNFGATDGHFDGDVLLYIGPTAGDYCMGLELDTVPGHSAMLKIESKDSGTAYPLAPYTPG
jgi:hypothetical protein